jgi:hypothetical protein
MNFVWLRCRSRRTWETAELLDAHGESGPAKRLNASLDGLLQEPVEVTRLAPILAGSAVQGSL